MFSFSEVEFRYSSKHTLFNNIGFSIPKAKTTLFIGDNGSGKSTVFKLALGLLKPQRGLIRFTEKRKSLRLAYLKQDTFFHSAWYLSVGEFISLRLLPLMRTNRSTVNDKIERIARHFDIQDILHKQLSALSLGQLKRAHLSQVFVDDADIFFLDEPTVYLDSLGKDKLYAKIQEEQKKHITIILCSHEFSHLPSYSDNIICLTGKDQDSVYHDFITYFQQKNKTVTVEHIHY